MKLFAYEFQRGEDGFVSKRNETDGTLVQECQAFNIARANRETLVGVFESSHGIERRVLYRPA